MDHRPELTFQWLAPRILALFAVVAVAGCGGGSGGSQSRTSAPTAATENRINQLQAGLVREMGQSGVQSPALAASLHGSLMSIAPGVSAAPDFPMIGAFVMAATSPPGVGPHALGRRAAVIHRGTMIGAAGPPTAGVDTSPTFYFDFFLGLWVNIAQAPTMTTYSLYLDEGMTEPAGGIVVTDPSGQGYPQVYSTTISITAGYLQGTQGGYQTTLNADGSGGSSYSDVYTDGSKDSGTTTWTAAGDSTWSDQTMFSDGSSSAYSGTFHADGSGTTHSESSDGYGADFVYNADGSGSGKISGPAPGLPATIVWDTLGDETITYADGTVQTIPALQIYNTGTVSTAQGGATASKSGAGRSSRTAR